MELELLLFLFILTEKLSLQEVHEISFCQARELGSILTFSRGITEGKCVFLFAASVKRGEYI